MLQTALYKETGLARMIAWYFQKGATKERL